MKRRRLTPREMYMKSHRQAERCDICVFDWKRHFLHIFHFHFGGRVRARYMLYLQFLEEIAVLTLTHLSNGLGT